MHQKSVLNEHSSKKQLNAIFEIMKLTIREQVKKAFREMPFADAFNATIEQRKQLLHVMTEYSIWRMCVETSKYAGMYNL